MIGGADVRPADTPHAYEVARGRFEPRNGIVTVVIREYGALLKGFAEAEGDHRARDDVTIIVRDHALEACCEDGRCGYEDQSDWGGTQRGANGSESDHPVTLPFEPD